MTATADSQKSSQADVRAHRFARPSVREIPSRRMSRAHTAATGTDGVAAHVPTLIAAARRGDSGAWERLIDAFSPMMRAVARSFRLAPSDVDDVVQETWIALHANIDSLRNPAAVPAWLATTVRRRSLGLLRAAKHEHAAHDVAVAVADHQTPEHVVLESECHAVFLRAVSSLPQRQRRVVTALAVRPDLDYQGLATLLQMPIGSLGPTRARGLASLQRDDELRFVHSAA